MVSYEPFWNTLEEKGVSQYALINDFNVSASLISKIKHSQMISLEKINDLCLILDCDYSDIIVFVKGPEETQYDDRILKYKEKLAWHKANEEKRNQKKSDNK